MRRCNEHEYVCSTLHKDKWNRGNTKCIVCLSEYALQCKCVVCTDASFLCILNIAYKTVMIHTINNRNTLLCILFVPFHSFCVFLCLCILFHFILLTELYSLFIFPSLLLHSVVCFFSHAFATFQPISLHRCHSHWLYKRHCYCLLSTILIYAHNTAQRIRGLFPHIYSFLNY